MNNKTNSIVFLVIGLILGGLMMHFCSNYTIERKQNRAYSGQTADDNKAVYQQNPKSQVQSNAANAGSIEDLTKENTVVSYIKAHHELPEYYITKSEAKRKGWEPSSGNLCDVLPGRAIGGDRFSNREKTLPTGAQYYEADVNYHCGNRGADRIVYTKNGDVWLTKNHYKSFEKQ